MQGIFARFSSLLSWYCPCFVFPAVAGTFPRFNWPKSGNCPRFLLRRRGTSLLKIARTKMAPLRCCILRPFLLYTLRDRVRSPARVKGFIHHNLIKNLGRFPAIARIWARFSFVLPAKALNKKPGKISCYTACPCGIPRVRSQSKKIKQNHWYFSDANNHCTRQWIIIER